MPPVASPSNPDALAPESVFVRSTTPAARKRLGQFFTPPVVAAAMRRWVCAHRPDNLLDPAVGPGVFIEELPSCRVLGVDIDPAAIAVARTRVAHACGAQFEFRTADFLTLDLAERFDAIIANPPYVRHHDARLPAALFEQFDAHFGVRFSRLTNIYCLFLLKIGGLLSPRGRAAVLTPVEFLNADFGRAVKQAMLANAAFAGFIVFDFKSSLFDGLMTTACVTLFDAARRHDEIRLVRVADGERLTAGLEVFEQSGGAALSVECGVFVHRALRAQLDPSRKWSTSAAHLAVAAGSGADASGGHPPRACAKGPDNDTILRPLSNFARCTRGIATGANDFFTLSDADVARWALPREVVSPCVTKARDALRATFSQSDWEALRAAGRPVWILDVPAGYVDADRKGLSDAAPAALASYIRHGEQLGLHERYLTRHRSPWFAIERREPADLWITVFGRKRLRFVHNTARVLSLTTFHAVYLEPKYRLLVGRLLEYLESPAFDLAASVEHRVYGDGLLKFEPRDVERLLVPNLDEWLDRRGSA